MGRRHLNPSTTTTVVAAVVSGIVGMTIGYALASRTSEPPLVDVPHWSYWVEHTGSLEYLPVIESPEGTRFELSVQITKFAAEKVAEDAIYERGGLPVPGKPA